MQANAATPLTSSVDLVQSSTNNSSSSCCSSSSSSSSNLISSNGTNNSTSNINGSSTAQLVERMYLHPFYLWSWYMITPIRYQKQIPNTKIKNINFSSEQTEEWVTKIWPHLRNMALQDKEIQAIRMVGLRFSGMALVIASILYTYTEFNHFLLMLTIGMGIMIYAIYKYIRFGEHTDSMSLHSQRKAIRWNILVLMFVYCLHFVIRYVYSATFAPFRSLDHRSFFSLAPLMVFIFHHYVVVLLYLLIVKCCRDGVFVFSFERQDKALKALYYQVKLFDGALTYFTLYPRIRFDNGDIAIDVYLKTSQLINHNHETIPQLPGQEDTSINVNGDGDTYPSDSSFSLTDPLLTRNNNV